MNRKWMKIWSMTVLFLLLTVSINAQETLERDSFVIVKEFVPTLSQASKIRINPVISDTHRLDLNLKYNFLDKKIETDFQPEPIKAATLKGEPLVKLYRNYAILGFGNNNTPLAEFYFNQLRSKKISYSLFARHLSSNGIKDIKNSDYSHNKVGLDGNYYTRKYTVTGRLKYNYDHINYYGFNEMDPNLDRDIAKQNEDVFQIYNNFNAAIGFGNNQRDTIGVRHYSEISFNRITDRFGASENRLIIEESMSVLNNTDVYLFDWSIDYNKYTLDNEVVRLDSNYENTIIYLKPGIELKGKKWRLTGALNIAGDLTRKLKIHIYPYADFRYQLIKSIIIPYAGITGNLKRNTYAEFATENPFISSAVTLENTDERFTFYAGIGGNMSKNTSFDVSFSQSSFNDMALYVKDTNTRESRAFNLVYDNVNRTKITAEVIYEPLERWNLVIRGDYFKYETRNEPEAWHKPDYRFSVLAGYNLGDKILIKLMTYFIGSQKAKLYTNEKSETLAGTTDINLDLEYRYTKKLSIFLDLNNIVAVKYEKYQDYPTQGFNVIGGFKFSF